MTERKNVLYRLFIFMNPFRFLLSLVLLLTIGAGRAGADGPTAPGLPTGLTATVVSSAQIDLSWAAPAAAEVHCYRIFRLFRFLSG